MHESTVPHQHGQAGNETPQPAGFLRFTDVAGSSLGAVTSGTVKLGNTDDTLQHTTLAQLLVSRLAFQQTAFKKPGTRRVMGQGEHATSHFETSFSFLASFTTEINSPPLRYCYNFPN